MRSSGSCLPSAPLAERDLSPQVRTLWAKAVALGLVVELHIAPDVGKEVRLGPGSSPGRRCHSTLPLAVTGRHPLGIGTVILLSLLSFSAKMTVSPSRLT